MQRLSRKKYLSMLMLAAILMAPLQAFASIYSMPAVSQHSMADHHCEQGDKPVDQPCHQQMVDLKQASMTNSHCDGDANCQHACDHCGHCQYFIPQLSTDHNPPRSSMQAAPKVCFHSHTPDAELRPPKHS